MTRFGGGATAVGIAMAIGGHLAGWTAVAIVGTGVVLLVVASAGHVVLQPRLALQRTIASTTVEKGQPAEAIVEVTNLAPWRCRSRPVRQWIGQVPVVSYLPRLAAGERARRVYPLPTTRRGRFEVSAPELPREDPFGLCRTARRLGEAEVISVHPRILGLRRVPTGVSVNVEGPTSDASPQGSITFHRLREYVVGDDLRTVHWPSSAHAGRLVVRHNVDTAEPRTVVVLDLDPFAYVGESFEEAVDVSASVVVSMSEGRAPVQLRTTAGQQIGGNGGTDAVTILDRLTDVKSDPAGSVASEMARLRLDRGGSALVVVTGKIEVGALPAISSMRRRFDRVVLVSVDPDHVRLPSQPGLGLVSGRDAAEGRVALELGDSPVRSRTAALVFLAALASFLSLAPVLPAFDVRRASLVVAVASVLGAGLAGLAHRRGLAPIATCWLSGVGVSLFLVLASGARPGAAWSDLVVVPPRLMTETLPLSGSIGLLDPVLLMAWTCAGVTADLLLRAKARGSAPVGLAAPVVIFVAASAVGATAPGTLSYSGPGLLMVLALTALACRAPRGREAFPQTGISRRLLPAGALAAVTASVLVASSLAVYLTPDNGVRSVAHRGVPVSERYLTDPLDAIASCAWRRPGTRGEPSSAPTWTGRAAGTSEQSCSTTTTGAHGDSRRRSSPPAGGSRAPRRPGICGTASRWPKGSTSMPRFRYPCSPVLETPSLVSGQTILADPGTGMVVPEGSGSAGVDYSAVSFPEITLREVPQTGLIDRSPGIGGPDLELPPDSAPAVETVLRYLGALTGERPGASVDFLDAAVGKLLSSDRRVRPSGSATSVGGQSSASNLGGTALAQVINSVTVDGAATPEQFATFVAVARGGWASRRAWCRVFASRLPPTGRHSLPADTR